MILIARFECLAFNFVVDDEISLQPFWIPSLWFTCEFIQGKGILVIIFMYCNRNLVVKGILGKIAE